MRVRDLKQTKRKTNTVKQHSFNGDREPSKNTGKLGAIVWYDSLWDPVAGKLRLENWNYRTGTSCLHALDFIETTVVIDSDEKIFVSELK